MSVWKIFVLVLLSKEQTVFGIDVRLVGGNSRLEGRIEVFYNNEWGTVCDDEFDKYDAKVFCYMLGYEREGAEVVPGDNFGPGSGEIWLDDLECYGTEISVDDCEKYLDGWGYHNCEHDEDAAIVCKERQDIRLTEGLTEFEGHIELFYLESWRPFCSNNLEISGAQVLCNMLDFPSEGAVMFSSSYPRQRNGSMWFQHLDCDGDEQSIFSCRNSTFGLTDCANADDIWIRCKPRVRLVGGTNIYGGRVEVFHSHKWGTVCDDDFEDVDAMVLCHMLGYKRDGARVESNLIYGEGSGIIWLDDLECFGMEPSVDNCSKTEETWGENNCGHNEDAAMICQPKTGCLGLEDARNGKYSDPSCTIATTPVGLKCTLLCNIGFEPSAYQHTMCLDTGIWNVSSDFLICKDKNECEGNPCGQFCRNAPGTYYCSCNVGYRLNHDNKTCTDVNECEESPCAQECRNAPGTYTCSCYEGYLFNQDNKTCIDINECADNPCDQICRNTLGTYECSCHEGYAFKHDINTCTDINECQANPCDQICRNTPGTYECSCNEGYRLAQDKHTCLDVNECTDDPCHQVCQNAPGTYKCSCNDGYFLDQDNKHCSDINECINNPCDHICKNTPGTYDCSCNEGYYLDQDSVACLDVDECANSPCKQVCQNVPGNYFCSCNNGYVLDQDNKTCTDVNECANSPCDQLCQNAQGSYACSCFIGYLLDKDNRTCPDINECLNNPCDQICRNTQGTYECTCNKGYHLDQDKNICLDINECQANPCDQICRNTPGTYECSCNEGYRLDQDKHTCLDINECSNNPCDHVCKNTPGTYDCSCNEGYYLDQDSITCLDIDECLDNPCDQICRNTQGTYECTCNEGYNLDRDKNICLDVDECANSPCNQICQNVPGSFICSCYDGFVLDQDNKTCSDINECIESPCDQVCLNLPGTYNCSCSPGYLFEQDSNSCTDINECTDNPCEHICRNIPGTYECSCFEGYYLDQDNSTCIDINECEYSPCDHVCSNTPGTYECSCKDGYYLEEDNQTCIDVNECAGSPCDHICLNAPGTYSCLCNAGYHLDHDNKTCIDITECDIDNGRCDHNCTNYIGSFRCSCLSGYILQIDGMTCNDINECGIDNGGCDHQCMNEEGSYFCRCKHGYLLNNDSRTCRDTNECIDKNGGCEQICMNTEGSFYCDCGYGYLRDNDSVSCRDLNECRIHNGGCQQICQNENGTFSCSCQSGFHLQSDGTTCKDINECEMSNGGCQQICENDQGSYTCGCFSGFSLQNDTNSCEDINECDTDNGGCEHLCSNENGTYSCSCKEGYSLDDNMNVCRDIDECLNNNGGCSGKCINIVGSFLCTCEKGFSLKNDLVTCSDVNECESENGGCEHICHNRIGSYICDCTEGYGLNRDNVSCDDIVECEMNNGGCQQTCFNFLGSFLCSCETGFVINEDGLSCKDVTQNSISSSLMVQIDIRKAKKLQDFSTYKVVASHITLSLQYFFEKFSSLPFDIVVQHIRKYREFLETDDTGNLTVNYTIVYEKDENNPSVRETLIRKTLGFNGWKALNYSGERIMVNFANKPPIISPDSLVITLSEDTPNGTVVGEFTVYDPDTDVRGEWDVYSHDKPKEITIRPVKANKVLIVLGSSLDADKYKFRTKHGTAGPVINFTITVTDKPGLKAQANVTLTIRDVNDNAPQCSPSKVIVKIPRDTENGSDVLNLTVCSDNDYYYNNMMYTEDFDSCGAFEINTTASLLIKESAIPDTFSSCRVTITVIDVDDARLNTTLDVQIKFFECPKGVDYLNKEWIRGTPGKFSYKACPENYKGKVKRFCDKDGIYREPFYNCTRSDIAEILKNVGSENVSTVEVLDDLVNVTRTAKADNTSLLIGDLDAVTTVMAKITEIIEVKAETVKNITDSFVETANNILDESTTTSWTSKINETGSGADTVLENLDRFVEKVANVTTSERELNVAKSNLLLTVGATDGCKEIRFPDRTGKEIPEWAEKTLDTVHIECTNNQTPKSYSSIMYRNLSQILPSKVLNSTNNKTLNAPVMSFSYFPKTELRLDPPIEITFQLYSDKLESPTCSFWSKSDSSLGGWSDEGCWLAEISKDKKSVLCKCDHLTNFAVLMSPSSAVSDDHTVALSVISMVGCIMSMLCLTLTVAVHCFFWRTVKSEKTIMNMNLSCVLCVAYLLFLTGVNQNENKSVCTAIAVLLHLVFLVVFFIMLSEGLLLAKTVLFPFNTKKLGMPLLIGSYVLAGSIVAISIGIVKLDGYGKEKSCWLSTTSGLIWAFLGPVLLVIVINFAIVTLVIRKMCGTAAMSKKTDQEKARAGVRSIIILMPIMGITWVFGIFSVNKETVVFQYLFAIFNSIQGVLIFAFHCVLNRKIQAAFRRHMPKWEPLRSRDITTSFAQNTKSSKMTSENTSTM